MSIYEYGGQYKETYRHVEPLTICIWSFFHYSDVIANLTPPSSSLPAFRVVEFSDANAKFYCRIYYAEEFHKMRDEIMESSEDDFVRSLSHCVNWQARGGKSGAVFYATEGNLTFNIFNNGVLYTFQSSSLLGPRQTGAWHMMR